MERERDYFNASQFDPQKPRPKRPVTDYGSTMVHWLYNRRPRWRGNSHMEMERPSPSYIIDMLPPMARPNHAADTIPAKALHSSLNKQKHPILVVRWTPEGRRLLTGSQSGEFTLWNGMGFNFETIMQAHDASIHAAEYSHSDDWLVSADRDGVVKYWQPNFNNVKAIQAHNEKINDLAFAPTDTKFVTASDDATLKLFDFAGGVEESTFTGHGWEAKTVDWHPTKGLLVSGSKDHQVKLWDPRTGRCLTTFHGHKNTVTKTSFHPTQSSLLATCARDNTARVYDLRMMRDVLFLRGHDANIMTLTWHPIHRNLLSTGGYDGALNHYLLDEQNPPAGVPVTLSPYDTPDPANSPTQTIYPAHGIPYAHDYTIWSLNWHPLGHILVSGSNDRVTRFWTRPRPGDKNCFNDRYHIGQAAAEAQGTFDRRDVHRQMQEEETQEEQDEAEGLVDQSMPSRQHMMTALPGISTMADGTSTGGGQLPGIGGAAPVIPQPAGLLGSLPILPGVDLSKIDLSKIDLSQLPPGILPGQFPPMPIPPNGAPGGFPLPPPPPPPGLPGFPNFPGGIPPPGLLPPGFQMPIGFPPPQPGNMPGLPIPPAPPSQANADAISDAVRRRAPLPSQKDSLREEMRKGKFRTAR